MLKAEVALDVINALSLEEKRRFFVLLGVNPRIELIKKKKSIP